MSQKVIPPSPQQIADMADSFGMTMSADEAKMYSDFLAPLSRQYDRINELVAPTPAVRYPRTPGHAPTPEENPHRAWYWKTDIPGASSGLLAGQRVAIKDNIFVAGVPLMNGTRVLEGFVPDFDATVVTRVLDAGGIIAGKAACESLCLSSQSYTCDTGPILNPRNVEHSAGGSSGGNAALVAAGEVSFSIGGDQGGSVRTPAAWCGIYGLKPTWGLVPCSGAMPISYAMDHLGPMCDSAENVAKLLTVIAGRDEADPRTTIAQPQDYMAALSGSVKDMRIGILKEAFGLANSDPESDAVVRIAIDHYRRLGAEVVEVSLPMHLDGVSIHTGIVMEGAAQMIFHGSGQGDNWNGLYATSLIEAFGSRWRSRPDELPYTGKAMLFMGHHMRQKYHGRYHGKAQNLKLTLTAGYDALFQHVDMLVMPTIPHTADKLPPAYSPISELIDASNMLQNTMPFDVTGHPAFSIPCGTVNGLPVGLMLVGRSMDDATLITAAQAFSQTFDWTSGHAL
ncbi:amidase [Pseudomonas syringae]|uniref:amidase n=1 Tax=Pseudomonas syringae TaxID=317 RepID=UPI00215A1DFD|nr:amidase [Pseudomonas syringae]MCR8718354.1 amidase [Pseudomonas syringae]